MADRIVIGANGRKYITKEPAPHKGEEHMSIHAIKVWFDGDKLVAQEIPEEKIYNQEPMAWRTFDGEGGYDYRNYEDNEKYAKEWEQRNPKYKGWVEPLYTAPRPWVGLTMADMAELRRSGLHSISDKAFETIANFLKEKNNR